MQNKIKKKKFPFFLTSEEWQAYHAIIKEEKENKEKQVQGRKRLRIQKKKNKKKRRKRSKLN